VGRVEAVKVETMLCVHCEATEMATCVNGEPAGHVDHKCCCVRVDGVRVAIGICCGHMVGDELLREEDYHDGALWRALGDCTCHPRDEVSP
jgi:hypothetical protein